jgi:hypothetical protein
VGCRRGDVVHARERNARITTEDAFRTRLARLKNAEENTTATLPGAVI